MPDSFIGQANLPIGLRNNNPGDIETGDAWLGMIGSEGGFVTFSDVTWGIRAMAKVVINDINAGTDTITLLITKYAPPGAAGNSDASTNNYIASVASCSGIGADDQLGTDNDTISSLVRCMMNFELGATDSALVSDDDIATGVGMVSASVPQLLSAGMITAQAYPLLTIGVIAGVFVLIMALSKEEK